MRVKVSKIVLPLLLAILLGGFSLGLASSPDGGASHADKRIVDDVKTEHAEIVADAHGETVAQDAHGAVDSHGSAKSSVTPEKLKDLFGGQLTLLPCSLFLLSF